eukprot:jgi/Tetstr1/423669/TSEL_014303.t1
MIFAFKDAVWAADFKTALGARFDIKDLGVCAWAQGMAVERDWDNATLKAAKRVLRYLKNTQTLGLTFSGGKAYGLLHGYCDADWAGDVVSRRSTTGFVFMLCGAAMSWKSQLQATVALSTAEAEYMAFKHIAIKYHFTREKVLSGKVAIEYCPTAQMVADALTKALGRLKHAEFAMQMLGA